MPRELLACSGRSQMDTSRYGEQPADTGECGRDKHFAAGVFCVAELFCERGLPGNLAAFSLFSLQLPPLRSSPSTTKVGAGLVRQGAPNPTAITCGRGGSGTA